jgi:hypothetical protein
VDECGDGPIDTRTLGRDVRVAARLARARARVGHDPQGHPTKGVRTVSRSAYAEVALRLSGRWREGRKRSRSRKVRQAQKDSDTRAVGLCVCVRVCVRALSSSCE